MVLVFHPIYLRERCGFLAAIVFFLGFWFVYSAEDCNRHVNGLANLVGFGAVRAIAEAVIASPSVVGSERLFCFYRSHSIESDIPAIRPMKNPNRNTPSTAIQKLRSFCSIFLLLWCYDQNGVSVFFKLNHLNLTIILG